MHLVIVLVIVYCCFRSGYQTHTMQWCVCVNAGQDYVKVTVFEYDYFGSQVSSAH